MILDQQGIPLAVNEYMWDYIKNHARVIGTTSGPGKNRRTAPVQVQLQADSWRSGVDGNTLINSVSNA